MDTENLLRRFKALEQRIRRSEQSLKEARLEASTLKELIDNSQSTKKEDISFLASLAVSKRNAKLGITFIDGKPVQLKK